MQPRKSPRPARGQFQGFQPAKSQRGAATLDNRRRGLDLGLLAVAVALADTHSASGAAVALGLSQPQISVALAKLRKIFNDPLFVRTMNGMQPTPRAAAFIESARGVLAQIDDALLADESFDPQTTRRPFVFALSDAGEMIVLPSVLPALRSAAPRAEVHSATLCSPAAEIGSGLESGRIDLAIGYLPDLRRGNLFQQVLFTDTFACIIRADHPFSGRRLTVEQFLEFDHVVSSNHASGSGALARQLAFERLECSVGLLSPHIATLPSLVAQTDMIMTVPSRLADYLVTFTPKLRRVELPFSLPPVEVSQYWHSRFQHDPRSKWLRSLVAQIFHREAHGALS